MPETLELCPACRARRADSAVCPRCGCDFSLVRQAEQQASRLLDEALVALLRGDRNAARARVNAALASSPMRLASALKGFLAMPTPAGDKRPAAGGGPLRSAPSDGRLLAEHRFCREPLVW
ncbi:hypothetical protein [Accumulibacter sp.]|uniref:hypothetical protein n=1 Tax=Accumulibacter sp. TaxID=2053492 RepID=UPI0025F47AA9|nr:hypothetical protein [Accumulibacter sp.]MCM8627846.1 hypothetical protein [Accumulibacter sp.]